jgi:hypothetical protein
VRRVFQADVEMRDKKDNATFDLPGFSPAVPLEPEQKRPAQRGRRGTLKQVQLELLEPTDTSGLPVWNRDDALDLTGLPVWAPDPSPAESR